MIRLAVAEWELAILPELGACLAALRWAGRDVLRPMPPAHHGVLDAACFPLLPYANRIAGGRFEWRGQGHALRPNVEDPRWTLHGLGWQRAWQVADQSGDAVRLVLDHEGDADWPWPFAAALLYALDTSGLTARLSLTNHADAVVPVGLGQHPYFTCTPATRLATQVAASWAADKAILPTKSLPADAFGDWAAGAPVGQGPMIDNAFDGWTGRAVIDHGDWQVIMTSDEARFFHLYRPVAASYFVAEPVTHLPNALNRPDMPPMAELAPGATAWLGMRIGARAC